ncbi:MAG: translation initiation factor, partial [Aquaticitalea sp.]
MDLQDQLKQLFPEHTPETPETTEKPSDIWIQDHPIICKYEKRKGKPITILEGYTGATEDFKLLAKELKT